MQVTTMYRNLPSTKGSSFQLNKPKLMTRGGGRRVPGPGNTKSGLLGLCVAISGELVDLDIVGTEFQNSICVTCFKNIRSLNDKIRREKKRD